ncbi:phage portal protein [Microlunatus parietis]|uniref:HK97 family phage portal protein n=1 Tax=Microlunatus parietis TaxID=682979 RepID=A0A7Y9I2R1_9ACTN|nr:phage portal protein [Microlunatus parietis]NYE68869.1 HK97 family phage portal protein [Microlunatus parietis]
MSAMVWPIATQPWNRVIFPAPTDGLVGLPMSVTRAKSIPAVARALQLIGGMARQMPLNDMKDDEFLPRPRLLEQPDPDQSRAWWVGVQLDDYLVNGNALCYVTARDRDGWPAAVSWLPADWTTVTVDPADGSVSYWIGGTELDGDRVIHVQRGAHPLMPQRGIGVVEQHMMSLARVADEEAYESDVLNGAAVPSVAVITPNPHLSTTEAQEAKDVWVEKFDGPARRPAILPAGTQVIPLSWSPTDSDLVEARKLSLTDVANMFNLDGYWVGAPAGSFTYRSPGPMYLNLIRQTVGPILEDFEGTWSAAWLPRGRRVRFDRIAVLKDDLPTMVTALNTATGGKAVLTQSEARVYLGYSANVPAELKPKPVPAALAAAAEQDQDQQDEQLADEEDQEG